MLPLEDFHEDLLKAKERIDNRNKGKVKCCDCAFVNQIKTFSELTGSGKCEHSDTLLIGFKNNGRTLGQPRVCHAFQPNETGGVE